MSWFGKVVRTWCMGVGLLLCLYMTSEVTSLVRAQQTEAPKIQRIEFVGNRRVRGDTLRARIFSREGDIYNEETLRRDFQALWNTNFFEDVRLRVEVSPADPAAKIVIFELQERPLIRRIRYEGVRSVSQSDILDRFKERKVGLTVESQLDPTRIKKAQVVLRELLGEHGRQFAKIVPQYERLASSNAVILIFKVEEGPKVKVGHIKFTGNHAFSDRKLIRAMRHDRPYAIPLHFREIPVLAKTYDREKLDEDLEVGIRGLYRDNGYFRVIVGDPVLANVDTESNRFAVPVVGGKRHGKAVNLTVPIEEGERYHMGTLKIVSADPDKALSLKVEALKTAFPLKRGDVFSTESVRKALETYGKIYGEYGFIDFTPEPDTDIDEGNKVINLTLKFDEQKQYYVRRIDFSGNTTTRDKVIRRELLIDEGQLFNKRLWEVSILRLNQLDYFERIAADKSVEIKRNAKDATVDLNLKLKEKGKQAIGLQGGLSGLSGGFIGLTYQTNNFLGLGETLNLSAQFGARQSSVLFGFTEPYLFDRPISTGFTVFDSRYSYNQQQELSILANQQVSINPATEQNYTQNSKGFTVFASFLPKRFSFTRVGLTYGYTYTDINATTNAAQVLFQTLQFRSFAGPAALEGIRSSKITPTITYNTIDNPVNPTHGKSFFYSLSFEGLGGNARSISQVFEAKYFRPVNHKRNVLGFRLQSAFTTGYGGVEPSPYQRYFTGGDDSVRGFDIRTISPVAFVPVASNIPVSFNVPGNLNGGGAPVLRTIGVPLLTYTIVYPGGDTQVVGNAEYRIPLAGPVSMGLFFDAGITGILRQSQLRLNSAGLAQLRSQFPNTAIADSLELAPGSNFAPRTSTGVEFVVQLPIIQAPFRIYWAVNPTVYSRTVTAPAGTFYLSDSFRDSLPPNIYDQYILPTLDNLLSAPQTVQFHERRTTFRFSVSRTF
ncbi:MAG TPA: outer membrane protein assembly factor BamA [Candidatus Saccharimonadales bacterium]|nr:outer membrane protein assembly factor BamA [Candidatus Saccharimonadales bacterium]